MATMSVEEASSFNALSSDDNQEHQVEWTIFNPEIVPDSFDFLAFNHLTFDSATQVIPESALEKYKWLQQVRIPSTVEGIETRAFTGCCLTNVDFQPGLQTIGIQAFQKCSGLKEAILPDTVRVIGIGAFQHCIALTNARLPNGLQVIEESTFEGCKSLIDIELPGSLVRVENSAFQRCSSLQMVKIPDSVGVIGYCAFMECYSLELVELPKRCLKKIQSHVFAHCERLSGIVIPSCVEEIKDGAFHACYTLLGVEFAKDSKVNIDPSAFLGCGYLVNVCLPGTSDGLNSSSSEFDTQFSCNDQLRDEDGQFYIRGRFAHLPIHRLCYHSSVTTVDEVRRALDTCIDLESTEWKDYLNMTPFHIVATAVTPRVDILECLLRSYKYPFAILAQEDRSHDYTMINFLFERTRGMQMLQVVLQHVFGECLWICAEELDNQINSLAECTDAASERTGVREIFELVGFHLQKELTKLLELASWKRRMFEIHPESSLPFKEGMDRESSRYQCGADVVIENVTQYLWANQSSHSIALSVFPFYSSY